jgi:hypothetical protein
VIGLYSHPEKIADFIDQTDFLWMSLLSLYAVVFNKTTISLLLFFAASKTGDGFNQVVISTPSRLSQDGWLSEGT